MILKALYDYYNRCEGLAPKGLKYQEIGYLIVIKEDGTFVRIESRMTDKRTASTFLVMQPAKDRSGRNYVPNYFWDKFDYIIGGDSKNAKKKQTFVNMVNSFTIKLPENKEIRAVNDFYSKYGNLEAVLSKDNLYGALKKSKRYISFLLEGNTKIVAENEEIIHAALSHKGTDKAIVQICLVTGIKDVIAKLHGKISLSKDSGPLVSFQKHSGYDSYGKEQGYNAPISETAEFAYRTALNTMLGKDSHNKVTVADRTFVFWASSNNEVIERTEESAFYLIGHSEKNVDDPNAKVEQVNKVFKAIYSGSLKTNLEDRFYILGLVQNSARTAVVYWSELPLKEFAGNILKHLDDMRIIDNRKEKKPYSGIKDILSAASLKGKLINVPRNLPEAVIKSIFQGLPYPFTLFSSCVYRLKAECGNNEGISIGRIAILKAYLNRIKDNNKTISVMLDKNNTNQGYLCGRLFAVLENLQYAANKQDSIRSGYMNAASSTPSAVYPTILKLSNSHYSKLAKDKKGLANFFDNQKGEILGMIQDFPDTLDLNDQGRFFLGYYHQKNHKEEKEANA